MNHTPFQIVVNEVKMLGLILRKGQGEYGVNNRDGPLASEYVTDDLTDAVKRGREMAAQSPKQSEAPMGPTGPRTARRSRMYRHNRKVAARRLRIRAKRDD